ncbi:MAG TPA: aromatic ring-hydroxylating dioxygenase subunit alpha [Chitinophagaceae bacterium]|jgi:phenylpropionate dioxygenase-like ring-hydroxylating dioxygenase large terminal subunit|nr:aromatic ring-hydroxylating dioxygenase subunit alpha [Chitinophagaceae bacterium]
MKFFVDPDIACAKTIDSRIYTSPQIFDEMKDNVFSSCWHFIGDTSLIEERNNCHPLTLLAGYLNEPILLTKDEAGEIHCLSNVCTHRGNLLIYEPCKSLNLRCKYHGRLFQLDGKFKSMPEFKEVRDFPSADDDLHSLPLFYWRHFLFTTLNPKFPPQHFLKDMMERVEWMSLNEFRFRPDLTKEFLIDANWALYCENYLEGFHIPFVHAGLNALIDYSNYETELFFPFSALQIGISKSGEDCFELPASSPDYGKQIAAYYFWVFPNMMFNFYPWGLSINVVQPLSVDKTKVSFLTYMWKEEKRHKGAGGDLDKVEMEDEEIVQRVQRGVRSRFYKRGRYSVTKERGTHHFHQLLAEFLNSENIQ